MKNIISRYRVIIWLLGGVFYSAGSAAQATDSSWMDLDYLRHSHPWLSSGQATGLRFIGNQKISVATLHAQKDNGSFRNFYRSDNSYTLNASTESFYRLNPKIAFHGKVDYEYFIGKNMGGSAFIDPYKNAIDIDEYADSTAGPKRTERYVLNGAVSAQVSPRLSLAASVNYAAANYAKLKDLRHVNKLLELEAQAGASYQLTPKILLGASYTYTRRVESVGFAVYGNTNKQYLSLINFGSFYGLAELHSDYGYTSQTNPLTDMQHAASLQFGWKINPRMEIFQQLSFLQRNGYFGERGSSSIVYTEHTGTRYASTSILTLSRPYSIHYFKLLAAYESLENFENVYQSNTIPGGNRVITYIGQNKVLNQEKVSFSAEYAAYIGTTGNRPRWAFLANATYDNRYQTVARFPYFRRQDISSYRIGATGKYSWQAKTLTYTASVGLKYGGGFGIAKKDGLYIPPSSNQQSPASRDTYLYQEYEYYTSPHAGIAPAFQLSRQINKRVHAFAKASYSFTRAWNTVFTGKQYHVTGIELGCYF